MDTDELIEKLKEFLGDEKLQKFLHDINGVCGHKKRLLWWQERAWDKFQVDHPEYAHIGYEELRTSLNLCEIHFKPLKSDTVPASYGYWDFPMDFKEALITRFPHARLMYLGGCGETQRSENQRVIYCETCRDELIKWNEERSHTIGIPSAKPLIDEDSL